MDEKPVRDSFCMMTELVFPNDTNTLGNLMGGRLMYMMDVCAAIAAQRHSNRICVTASVDSVEFNAPIHQGEVVVIEGRVNRAFRTSMEVELNVWAENPRKQTRRKCNRAYYTFVAVDGEGHPVPIPQVLPETDEERLQFERAAQRRELRLLLSGRMSIEDAQRVQNDLMASRST